MKNKQTSQASAQMHSGPVRDARSEPEPRAGEQRKITSVNSKVIKSDPDQVRPAHSRAVNPKPDKPRQTKVKKTSHSVRGKNPFRQWGPAMLLISPSVLLIAVFVYGLIGSNIYTSLQDTNSRAQVSGFRESHFVGFENFANLFGDADFQHSLLNLVIFTAVFLIGALLLGFLWSWLLDKPIRGEGLFRSIFLFPMAVSFIASGVVWRWLLNSATGDKASGLNRLFQMLGLGFLQNEWTTNVTWGVAAIAIPAIWQLAGYVMALFLAGFRGISDDIREAARIDGANEWQIYRSVIFPQLTPVALSAVIIIGHMSLKSFDLIMSITDQRTYSTKVPAIDMFNMMTISEYSNAAAVGTILLVLVAIAVIPYLIHDARSQRR